MQKASFAQTERYDPKGVVDRINELASRFRKTGGAVVFVQHDGNSTDGHEAHTESWEILDELVREKDDWVVRKTSCDSFYKTRLELILRDLDVHELIITGCATDFCIDTTIRSSLSKGLSVTIPQGCHTTADRPYLKATEVIKHHEWVWKDLICPDSEIRVQTFEDTIKQIT